MTPEHGSPEFFTSGTILAGGLGSKTNRGLAAAEQELTGSSTSFA